MQSILHDGDNINSSTSTKKPEIITFYNLSKGGVDVFNDMKCE